MTGHGRDWKVELPVVAVFVELAEEGAFEAAAGEKAFDGRRRIFFAVGGEDLLVLGNVVSGGWISRLWGWEVFRLFLNDEGIGRLWGRKVLWLFLNSRNAWTLRNKMSRLHRLFSVL